MYCSEVKGGVNTRFGKMTQVWFHFKAGGWIWVPQRSHAWSCDNFQKLCMACLVSLRAIVIWLEVFSPENKRNGSKQWITWRCLFFMGWDVDPTKLALYWIFSCNRSCFIYVIYSKTSCLCNFFLTMSDFELQRLAYYSCFFLPAPDNRSWMPTHIYANTEKIKYPVSHIAGWCTWSACRLHNLPNQKVKKKLLKCSICLSFHCL